MNLSPLKQVALPPSNFTDTELERYVRNEYPDLSGALKMLLERFAVQDVAICEHDLEGECSCPSCGTKLQFNFNEEGLSARA